MFGDLSGAGVGREVENGCYIGGSGSPTWLSSARQGTPSSLGQGAHWPPTPSLGFIVLNSSASLAPPGRTISFSEDSPCVPTVPQQPMTLGHQQPIFR